MYKLNYKEMMYLKDIKLYTYGYAYLLRYFSKEEVEEIRKKNDIKLEVEHVVNTLNERKSLPQEYKSLVDNYNGFNGILIPKEEIEF